MHKVERWLGPIDTFSEWTGKIIAPLIAVVMLIVMSEVVLRYFFNAPTAWAHESSAMVFGAYFILGGGYVLRRGSHVKMDVFYATLSLRTKAILDVATSLMFFAFCGVILWYGGEMALRSLRIREFTQSYWAPPIYPVKLTIPVGAFLILLQGSAKFIRDLITATTGRATVKEAAWTPR